MSFESLLVTLLNYLRKRTRRQPKRGDLVLGVSTARDSPEPFVIFPEALRAQHLGIMGLSGSGKTYLIEHMIRQDIQNKIGFVMFDVHGDLADSVIAYLAERAGLDVTVYERTVIIEPFDPERTFGFNPLEQNPDTSPYLQAQEFAGILRKRWQEDLLSPRNEELLRNCLYTLSTNNQTLLQFPELLTQKKVRDVLVEKLDRGDIQRYWTDRFDKLSPRMQATICEPLLTRISSFLSDPQIRNIVGHKKSTLSFREAIRKGLWVIVNLSKGRLGENSTILGSMLFTKLELEVMSLANVPEEQRKLFAVYADELQNLTGDTFGRLIAEARKYKVALVAGHQYWRQLEVSLRHAMLAVGSKAFFRLHYHDAGELAGELAADEKMRYARLLTTLERGEAVVRLGGSRPEVITIPVHRHAKPTAEEVLRLKEESARRYTRLRAEIHHGKDGKQPPFPAEKGKQAVLDGRISHP